jgi:hypothetical protein
MFGFICLKRLVEYDWNVKYKKKNNDLQNIYIKLIMFLIAATAWQTFNLEPFGMI